MDSGPELPMVLVVDDEPAHVALLNAALQDEGIRCRIEYRPDGGAALAYLDCPTAEPAAFMLLDVRLPGCGGLEVLRLIRQRPRLVGMPVVMLSTSDADSDINSAYAAGANGYVVKSPDYDGLRDLVRQVFDYWLRANRPGSEKPRMMRGLS